MTTAEIQARHDWVEDNMIELDPVQGEQAHQDRAWLLSDRVRLETEIRLLRKLISAKDAMSLGSGHEAAELQRELMTARAALAEFDKGKT